MGFKKIYSRLTKTRPHWLNSELVFYFAIAMLPFENFWFAPSEGWAAISPVILAFYVLLNIKLLPKTIFSLRQIFGFFFFAVILGSATAFFNVVNAKDYLSSFVPLILGAILLLSFYIFYKKQQDLRTVINIVVVAYAVAVMIGFFEFLALKLNNHFFAEWLSGFFKRDYLVTNARVQFFFTEPSFIGMHLFGILLPLYWLSRRKDLLFIMALFAFEAIAFNSGVRVIIDIAVVATIYFFYLLLKHKQAKWIPLILLIFGLSFGYFYNNNIRVKKIIDAGIYADGSLASRYFRIQASVIGYAKTPTEALIGYGMGNSIKPLHLGYDEARALYTSDYLREVEALDNKAILFHDDSVAYSLYIRFISEYGLILALIGLTYLFMITKRSLLPQRWLYLIIILYIYVQFESLGFYSLWLFIVTMLFTSRTQISNQTLLNRITDNVFRKKSHV